MGEYDRGSGSNSYIYLNDQFEMYRDRHCWRLYEIKERMHKDGKPRIHKYATYHKDLKSVACHIAEMLGHGCETMEELVDKYDRLLLRLERYVELQAKEVE